MRKIKIVLLGVLLCSLYINAFEFKVNKHYYMSKDNINSVITITENIGNVFIGRAVERVGKVSVPFKLIIKEIRNGVFSIDIFVNGKKSNVFHLKEQTYGVIRQISKESGQFYPLPRGAIVSYNKQKNVLLSKTKKSIQENFSTRKKAEIYLARNSIKALKSAVNSRRQKLILQGNSEKVLKNKEIVDFLDFKLSNRWEGLKYTASDGRICIFSVEVQNHKNRLMSTYCEIKELEIKE